MPTLDHELGEISHQSVLLRAACRTGLAGLRDFVRLAVARGCTHYASLYPPAESDPGLENISNEELVALLLLGSNEFEPIAVRCAAQLASKCQASLLAIVARRERICRALAYIAKEGQMRDSDRKDFWGELLTLIGPQREVPAGTMPHWSRFVLQTGVTRSGVGAVQWLHCQ